MYYPFMVQLAYLNKIIDAVYAIHFFEGHDDPEGQSFPMLFVKTLLRFKADPPKPFLAVNLAR